MGSIKTTQELSQAIQQLEIERNEARATITVQVKHLQERFAPENILKSILHNTSMSSVLDSDIVRTTITLLIGRLSKAAFVGGSKGWVKKAIGSVLSVSLINFISRHPEIMNTIRGWMQTFTKYAASKMDDVPEDDASDEQAAAAK